MESKFTRAKLAGIYNDAVGRTGIATTNRAKRAVVSLMDEWRQTGRAHFGETEIAGEFATELADLVRARGATEVTEQDVKTVAARLHERSVAPPSKFMRTPASAPAGKPRAPLPDQPKR